MNKTKVAFLTLLCVLLMALTTVAAAKELKLGLIVPGSHAWSQAAETLGEDLENQTNGEFSVAVFPAGQLGSEAQMLQQLQTGALDMAFMTVSEVANRVPDMGALFAPYLVDDVMQADKLLNTPTAQGLLEQLPSKAGVVGLGYGVDGMRLLLTGFPAEHVNAINNRKIRIPPFPPVQDFYRLLGAASTPMPVTDVYDALANGQVDGVDADLELIWKLRLYERANTVLLSNHMMFPVVGLISARTWSQLDQGDRVLSSTMTRERLAELAPYYQ